MISEITLHQNSRHGEFSGWLIIYKQWLTTIKRTYFREEDGCSDCRPGSLPVFAFDSLIGGLNEHISRSSEVVKEVQLFDQKNAADMHSLPIESTILAADDRYSQGTETWNIYD